MIAGIGVDLVDINFFDKMIRLTGAKRPGQMFTADEWTICNGLWEWEKATYLATRWASKEAVFKALAHLLSNKTFDLRLIETLNDSGGKPYITYHKDFKRVIDKAGVRDVHITITTEMNLAMAVAVAEQ